MSDDSFVIEPQTSDTPVRILTDLDGRTWTVRELAPGRLDRRSGSTLVFDTDEIMRRIRVYPENWFDLSDADLYALSLGR